MTLRLELTFYIQHQRHTLRKNDELFSFINIKNCCSAKERSSLNVDNGGVFVDEGAEVI